MTKTVPTQIRIDEDVKKKATKLFKSIGIDMSSAVNIFLNQCIINEGLPFLVSSKKNTKLDSIVAEAYEVHNSKKIKGYHNVDTLFKDMGYDEWNYIWNKKD